MTAHDEFYFPDGNLLVLAGNIKFRVYRGPLSSQSPVLAQQLDREAISRLNTVDDVPALTLDDAPSDIELLLRVCLEVPKKETWRCYDVPSIVGTLSVASKYGMKKVVSWAKQRLHEWCPTTFKALMDHGADLDLLVDDAALIATACDRFHVPEFHAVSLYVIWSTKWSDLPKREDGKQQRPRDVLGRLSLRDRDRLILARERLCEIIGQAMDGMPHYGGSERGDGCGEEACDRTTISEMYSDGLAEPVSSLLQDPIQHLLHMSEDGVENACWGCNRRVRLRSRRWAKNIFNQLAFVFDTDPEDRRAEGSENSDGDGTDEVTDSEDSD